MFSGAVSLTTPSFNYIYLRDLANEFPPKDESDNIRSGNKSKNDKERPQELKRTHDDAANAIYFAYAVYSSKEFGKTEIAICSEKSGEKTDFNDESASKFQCYYQMEICQKIMEAAAKNTLPCKFNCNDVEYLLERYSFNDSERFYNKFRTNHITRKVRIIRDKTIFVYKEKAQCPYCFAKHGYQSIEQLCAQVPIVGTNLFAEIDVQHCKSCDRYLIESSSLAIYEAKYGVLFPNKRHIFEIDFSESDDSHIFSTDTVLSRNGYSTKLYTWQREEILSKMLDSGISTKAEIKSILSRFIRQRGNRCKDAKQVWEQDLAFVNYYKLKDEDEVVFESKNVFKSK